MAQLDNDITVKPLAPVAMEQVVELSIVLTGEMYSENLDDPGSLQYQTLSRQLADKVRRLHSFGKMCCVSPNKVLRFLIASDFGPVGWLQISGFKREKEACMTHLGPPSLVFPRLHKATEAQQQYLHVGSD